MTCAHGVGNRLIQEKFNHSGETIHRHFHQVLGSINKFAKNIIKPHPHHNNGVSYHMPQNNKYLPFFKARNFDGKEQRMTIDSSKKLYMLGMGIKQDIWLCIKGKIFVITLKIFVVQEQDNCVNLAGTKKSLIFYIRLVEISLSILLEARKHVF
ncbi:hypothetical protein RJ641_006445 [Dillenia turbinata]|uniref:DUF8040 domain-containing protein n=1 Tax=Dillenia turbinata TaxID=194707 RepID=A0AAN8Z636_9MAGN